jgi:ferredoxin
MAIIAMNEKEKEVDENIPLQAPCEELGIPFGCKNGLCRTCEIIVEEGMENLSAVTEQEKVHELPEQNRLACQCSLTSGKIKVKSTWD